MHACNQAIELGANFTAAESSLGDFRLQICFLKGTCQSRGIILIERVIMSKCVLMESRWTSNDSETDAFNRAHIGLDEFFTSFSGPQKYSPFTIQYLGKCRYKIPFHLSDTGTYSVSLLHTYSNFDHVFENGFVPPVRRNQYLLYNYPLSVCIQCSPFSAKKIEGDVYLPVCDRRLLVKGDLSERQQYKQLNYGHPYIWIPFGYRFDQRFELGANDTCFSHPRMIGFVGDSHVREVYNLFRFRLEGNKHAHSNRTKNPPKYQHFYFGFNNTLEDTSRAIGPYEKRAPNAFSWLTCKRCNRGRAFA
ncbi:hypothetical protein BC830DRAFT_51978 [Chytriomyces sp. MP71]|nr:hypothetical protein BC830DRAFT_51978 [Chytriomyces sp. MP71]